MQYFCSKCGAVTNDSDDIHCRKDFIIRIQGLILSNDLDKAKKLFLSESFDEKWKRYVLNKFGGEIKKIVSREIEGIEREKINNFRKTLERKHQEYYTNLGIEYRGSDFHGTGQRYISHCYSCKSPLDSYINIECNICHWLICECGAGKNK